MSKQLNLEKLIHEGSTSAYFSLNLGVKTDEIWAKEKGLEKVIGLKNPGDAVTLIGAKGNARDPKGYFLYGVFSMIPIQKLNDSDSKDGKDGEIIENYNKVYESMIPGVAYINPISLGISTEDLSNLSDDQTGPVKTRGKEFLGIINVDYLTNIEKGKINKYFLNAAYFRKEGKLNYKKGFGNEILNDIGMGVGMIPSKITDKIAARYGYPKPSAGDFIVGIGYGKNYVTDSKDTYAFQMVVSETGEKMQVPPEILENCPYLEVILGMDKKVGKRLIA